MNLKGKTILVTGATGGIGNAIVKQLAACEARLILVARQRDELNDVARRLKIADNAGFTLQADIATEAGRETIRTALIALPRGVDIFIHCAGTTLFGFLEDNEPATIENLINTNVTASILLTRQMLPFMSKNEGRMLLLGSSFGELGFPGFTAYCASKFALRGFCEALRRELADSAIQIAHVAPRATNTALNSEPVVQLNNALGNRVDEPEVVAFAVMKLLHRKKLHDINLGWPEKLFIWINAIFPGLIDKGLRNKLPVVRRFAHPTQRKTHTPLATSHAR